MIRRFDRCPTPVESGLAVQATLGDDRSELVMGRLANAFAIMAIPRVTGDAAVY